MNILPNVRTEADTKFLDNLTKLELLRTCISVLTTEQKNIIISNGDARVTLGEMIEAVMTS